MTRRPLFDPLGNCIAATFAVVTLSGVAVAIALSQADACKREGVDEHLARSGAPTEDVERWFVSGCDTDMDCERMEEAAAYVCANEDQAVCDSFVRHAYFRD